MQRKYYSALKVSLIFFILSVLYIIFSDSITRVLLPENSNLNELTHIQTIKGLAYVFITSIIIFILIQNEINYRWVYTRELELKSKSLNIRTQELKEIKESVSRRNTFIETILDNLPIGLAVNKINEGSATYMNKKFSEIYGWSAEELNDIENFFTKVYPDKAYREKIRAMIMEDINSGDTSRMKWTGVSVTTKKGINKYVEASNIPLYEQNLMISTVQDITERILTETKNYEYQKSLKELSTELLLAEEKQRKNIAANIHDHLSQLLVISKMKLAEIKKSIDDRQLQNNISLVQKYLNEALANSRIITYDLCPPILYQLGLKDAVEWLGKKIEDENKLKVLTKVDYVPVKIEESGLILIYRIVQELLNNVVKHAGAKEVSVNFSRKKEFFVISVKDDGIGFKSNEYLQGANTFGGFGIFAVKERLNNLKGVMKIKSKPGKGTNIEIQLPVEE